MTEVTLGLSRGFSHGRVITELSTVTSPAVGTALTIKISPKYWELPRSLTFSLSAGADDVISDVTLQYLDYDGVAIVSLDTNVGVAAGTSGTYSFLSDWTSPSAWSNNIVNALLPPLFLQGGYSIVVTPAGTFTEGQITNVRWYRERFITGPGGYEIGQTFDESKLTPSLQILRDELS